MSSPIIDSDRIRQLFFDAGLDAYALDDKGRFIFADAAYVPVTKDYVMGGFSADLAKLQEQLDDHYESEDNDCDDFARLAAAFACYLWYRTPNKPANATLAVAEFWYESPEGGHAINCFVVVDGDALALEFYEPQNDCPVKLSRAEIGSAKMVRF